MAKKTKKRTASAFKTKANREILRQFGDLPVVDAKQSLRLFVQPEDRKGAIRKDPAECVFARACIRQFSATKVLFWKTFAYVDLPYRNNSRRVERFAMSPAMRDLVERFDRGEAIPDISSFELKVVKPSETFEGKAARKKAWRAKRQAAIALGTLAGPPGRQGQGAYSRPALVVDLSVRSGQGRVHFKTTKPSPVLAKKGVA